MVDIPEWGIHQLAAKVDTGARSSALHVESIERRPGNKVRFEVVVDRDGLHKISVTAPIRRVSVVRSSSGHPERRFFVATELKLGPVLKEIEIGLTSRHLMRFRMLLGRLSLGHDFVIDPGRRYVATKKKGRKKKKRRSAPDER
jgi:hypothetical protein